MVLVSPVRCVLVARIITALLALCVAPLIAVCIFYGVDYCQLDLRAAPPGSLIAKTQHIGRQYFSTQMAYHPLYYAIFSKDPTRYVLDNYTEAFTLRQREALFASTYGKRITVYQGYFAPGFPQAEGSKFVVGGPDNATTLIKIDNNITDDHERKKFLQFLEEYPKTFKFADPLQQAFWEANYEVHVTGVEAMTRDLVAEVWKDMLIFAAIVVPVGYIGVTMALFGVKHRAVGNTAALSRVLNPEPEEDDDGLGEKKPSDITVDEQDLSGSPSQSDNEGESRREVLSNDMDSAEARLLQRPHCPGARPGMANSALTLTQYVAVHARRGVCKRLCPFRTAALTVAVVFMIIPWGFISIPILVAGGVAVSSFAPMMLFLVTPLMGFLLSARFVAELWQLIASANIQRLSQRVLMEAREHVSLCGFPSRHPSGPGIGQAANGGSAGASLPEDSMLLRLDTTLCSCFVIGITDTELSGCCDGSLPTEDSQDALCKVVSDALTVRVVTSAAWNSFGVLCNLPFAALWFFGAIALINVQCLGTAGIATIVGVVLAAIFCFVAEVSLAIALFDLLILSHWGRVNYTKPRQRRRRKGEPLSTWATVKKLVGRDAGPDSLDRNGGANISASSSDYAPSTNSSFAPTPPRKNAVSMESEEGAVLSLSATPNSKPEIASGPASLFPQPPGVGSNGSVRPRREASSRSGGSPNHRPARATLCLKDRISAGYLYLAVKYDALQHFLLRSTSHVAAAASIFIVSGFCLIVSFCIYRVFNAEGDVAFFHMVPRHTDHVVYGRRLLAAVTAAATGPSYVVYEAPKVGGVFDKHYWYNVTRSMGTIRDTTGFPLANISSVTFPENVLLGPSEALALLVTNISSVYRYLWNMNVDPSSTLMQVTLYPTFDPYTQKAVPFNEKMGPLSELITKNATGAFKFVGWYGANAATWAARESAMPHVVTNLCVAVALVFVLSLAVFYNVMWSRSERAVAVLTTPMSSNQARVQLSQWRWRLLTNAFKGALLLSVLSAYATIFALTAAIEVFQYSGPTLEGWFPVLRQVDGVTWMVYPFCAPVVLFVAAAILCFYLDEALQHVAAGQLLLLAADARDAALIAGSHDPLAESHGEGNSMLIEGAQGDDNTPSKVELTCDGGARDSRGSHGRERSMSSVRLLRASMSLLEAPSAAPLLQLQAEDHQRSVALARKRQQEAAATTNAKTGQYGTMTSTSTDTNQSNGNQSNIDADETIAREAYLADWMGVATYGHLRSVYLRSAYPTASMGHVGVVNAILLASAVALSSLLFACTTMVNEMGVILVAGQLVLLVGVVPLLMPALRRVLALV